MVDVIHAAKRHFCESWQKPEEKVIKVSNTSFYDS